MEYIKSVIFSFRTWILLPLGFQALHRGIVTFPLNSIEAPAPYVGQSAPLLFSILWGITGIGLILAAFGLHSKTVWSPGPSFAKIRFDDAFLLLFIALTLTWGLGYTTSWIINHESAEFSSGRNFISWAVSMFATWYMVWSNRTRQEFIEYQQENKHE